MIELELEDWVDYLVRNRKRIAELIYIRLGQRIIAARPPYQLPYRKRREIVIRFSIARLREILARS